MILTYLDNKCGNWFSRHPLLVLFLCLLLAIVISSYGEHRYTIGQFNETRAKACQDRIKNTEIANLRTRALKDMFDTYNESRVEQAKWPNLTPAQRQVLLYPVLRWRTVDRDKIQETKVHVC